MSVISNIHIIYLPYYNSPNILRATETFFEFCLKLIVLLAKFCFIRGCLVVFLAFEFFFTSYGLLVQRLTPNLEDQLIGDRGFLPLAFDKSMYSSKAADASLVRPGYIISPEFAIQRRRLKWYGHLLRMEDSRLPKKIYQWTPHGRRIRGRPQ